MIKGEQFLPFVSIAYFILLTLLGFRWVVGYQQTQHIRNIGIEKINVSWRLFVSKIAEETFVVKSTAAQMLIKPYTSEIPYEMFFQYNQKTV